MLTTPDLETASALLFKTWNEKKRLAALPEALQPSSREEAYKVQALIENRTEFPLFGWKIAATSLAGQAHIGVSGPLAGRILHERVFQPGAAISLDGNLMRVAEVEFAFRMGRDIAPRDKPYALAEVLECVESLHPAIEVPDSRYSDFVNVGECQLIADNACAHQFMLGAAAQTDWRNIDLAQYQVRIVVRQDGHDDVRAGIGSNVLGDPRIALTWIANELSAFGITLKAGQAITTGTCLTPIVVAPGDEVYADYGALGSISVRFTS
jgi:2-keto-4-pentenoate hydratase